MKKIFFLLFVAAIAVACGQDKAKIKAMEEEAIALHDEVMPEMGTIIELKGLLKARMAALDTAAVAAIDTTAAPVPTELEILYSALETAEEGMKNWMHSYEAPDYKKSLEELEPVMTKQLEDMKSVHAAMKKSIADAQAALAQ